MAPKLCAERLVLVPKRPLWKKKTWQKKKKLEYREQVELRAGSTWFTYERGETRLRTNVHLTRRTWEREVGKTGPGVELSSTASPRLSCNRRRALEGQPQCERMLPHRRSPLSGRSFLLGARWF